MFRKRKKDSKLTSFAGRGLVAAPYATVAEFVKDVDSTYVWDKFLVVSICYSMCRKILSTILILLRNAIMD